MEDTLKATKLRMLYILADYSSATFGNQLMSLVAQAVSQRQRKELMTTGYDTIQAGVLYGKFHSYVSSSCIVNVM